MAQHAEKSNYEPISADVVAEQVLWLRKQWGLPTTPMHVIKLVYLCHGWMLGLHGVPLIKESVEPWRYGPVVPTNYDTYKKYGGGAIDVDGINDRGGDMDPRQKDVIEEVVEGYKNRSAINLSNITHKDGTPWSKVRTKDPMPEAEMKIPDELIKTYYQALAHQEE